jgi:hypothetical protein
MAIKIPNYLDKSGHRVIGESWTHRFSDGFETHGTTGRQIILVNPESGEPRYRSRERFVLWFGAYGATYLMVWADHLEDALEEAIDWIVEHAPGLLADEQVEEAYRDAQKEHGCHNPEWPEWCEQCGEEAEMDTTCFGHSGIHYLHSWEWGIVAENPSRDDLRALIG